MSIHKALSRDRLLLAEEVLGDLKEFGGASTRQAVETFDLLLKAEAERQLQEEMKEFLDKP